MLSPNSSESPFIFGNVRAQKKRERTTTTTPPHVPFAHRTEMETCIKQTSALLTVYWRLLQFSLPPPPNIFRLNSCCHHNDHKKHWLFISQVWGFLFWGLECPMLLFLCILLTEYNVLVSENLTRINQLNFVRGILKNATVVSEEKGSFPNRRLTQKYFKTP